MIDTTEDDQDFDPEGTTEIWLVRVEADFAHFEKRVRTDSENS